MKKENLKFVLLAVIIGVLIGRYIFAQYKVEAKNQKENNKQDIYLLQYGVYSSEENMINNTKDLKNYFYYKVSNQYHVLIGITKKENLRSKIVESYGIKDNIYMKRVEIKNQEFLNLLDQYDKLVETTTDKDTILSSQKQILSKYEELILTSE